MIQEQIATGKSGFGVWRDGSCVVNVKWTEIHQVVAFKRDLVTTDLVCWQMHLLDERTVELNEEMPGWSGFVDTATEALADFPAQEEWLERVLPPAFAVNETILFNRR